MINLLPQEHKKKLLRERRLRLGAILLSAFFLLEVLAAVFFAPSYLFIQKSTNQLLTELENEKQAAPQGGDKAQEELAKLKKDIAILKPSVATRDMLPSQALNELLEQKPVGIALSAFAYGRTDKLVSVQLNGIAGTREDLLAFQRSLQANPHFADVKYAQSFITRKTDIDFTLTVTIK